MKIVFMGTPDFAATCLQNILNSNHEVVGVVTAPDRKAGRGRKVKASAVKELALKHNLPIAQPEKLRSEEFHAQLKEWNADLGVVVAFRMLPEVVWKMPPKGTINLHASLLPQFRGAAPIQRAIMAGASVSGASTFYLSHKIDTGDIIDAVEVEIGPNENAGSLHDRILEGGSKLLVKTLDKIESGDDTPISQDAERFSEIELLEAPKIFKEDRIINWEHECIDIHNHIRGLSPYPCAITFTSEDKETPTKILSGTPTDSSKLSPGEIDLSNNLFLVGTATSDYQVTKLQPAGKSAMDADSFIRGLRDELTRFF